MRRHRCRLITLVVLIMAVAACGGSDDEESVATTAPTATSAAEVTEPPATEPASTTVAPTTEPTTTSDPADPEPDLAAPFRDEFDGELLTEARWTWLNEDPDGWRIEDGRLVITAATTDLLIDPVNVLTRELPPGLDVSVQIQLAARESIFEATGVAFVGEDVVAAVLLGYCDSCPSATADVPGFYGVAYRGDENLLAETVWFEWFGGLEQVLRLDWSPEAGVLIGSIGDDENPQRVFRLDDTPTFDRIALVALDLADRNEAVDLESRFGWVDFRSYS